MIEHLFRDIQYSIRSMSRTPAFTTTAVLSLALGIGLNVAVFSVAKTLFLEILPVRNADRLVELTLGSQAIGKGAFTYPMFERIRTDQAVFSEIFGWASGRGVVQAGDEAERLQILEVSDNFYRVLGVSAAAGRLIGPEHAETSNAAVAVLGHGFWQQRYGGRGDAIGQTVRVEGVPMIIIGVQPSWFQGLDVGNAPDIIVPIAAEPILRPTWKRLTDRGTIWLRMFAYLQPGTSIERARAGLQRISPAVMADVAPATANVDRRQEFLAQTLNLEPASTGVSNLRDRFASPIATVMVMVAILLTIATANVANLFVGRTLARRQETAVRFALGASPRDIIQQFLVDGVVLAVPAAMLGVVIAWWAVQLLVTLMSPSDAPIRVGFTLDPALLLFTAAVAIMAAMILGLVAASRARSASLSASLHEAGRGGSRSRVRMYLVGAQVALSTLLLVGAGLFARTLLNLRNVDLGFSARGLVLIRLDPKRTGLKQEQLAGLYLQLVTKIDQVPGVRVASLVSHGPLGGDRWNDFVSVDNGGHPTGAEALFSRIGAQYFATIGTPVLRGRDITDRDTATAPPVAVVNESFVRKFFGSVSPVGGVIRVGEVPAVRSYEVVGVVKDAKFRSLREDETPMVYLSFQQSAARLGEMTLVARAEPGVAGTPAALSHLLTAEAPTMTFQMRTMSALVDTSLLRERILASLAVAFGMMAVALAAVGLYGVIAHAVISRTREIGLHMALGATIGQVTWVLVRGLLAYIGSATVIGCAAAIALAQWIRSLLFQVTPADPLTLASVTLFVLFVAMLAGVVPLRHAARIDPAVALRHS
jgi:predicted permease